MSNIHINKKLGFNGELLAFNLINRALNCKVKKPDPDQGIDGICEYKSPITNNPIHFGIQIKTGHSFARENKGKDWQIVNLNRMDFEKWKQSKLPIIFIWVHPDEENKAYWHLINKNTKKKYFFIPKSRDITPCLPYDLSKRLDRISIPEQVADFELLFPPLSKGIRPAAKDVYRNLMVGFKKAGENKKAPFNPWMGPVRLSLHGWRHISHQKRRRRDIFRSFQLIPAIKWIIENPSDRPRIVRKFEPKINGKWVSETRLVLFHCNFRVVGRTDASVGYILRETIRYPVFWPGIANLDVRRSVIFESVYEKKR